MHFLDISHLIVPLFSASLGMSRMFSVIVLCVALLLVVIFLLRSFRIDRQTSFTMISKKAMTFFRGFYLPFVAEKRFKKAEAMIEGRDIPGAIDLYLSLFDFDGLMSGNAKLAIHNDCVLERIEELCSILSYEYPVGQINRFREDIYDYFLTKKKYLNPYDYDATPLHRLENDERFRSNLNFLQEKSLVKEFETFLTNFAQKLKKGSNADASFRPSGMFGSIPLDQIRSKAFLDGVQHNSSDVRFAERSQAEEQHLNEKDLSKDSLLSLLSHSDDDSRSLSSDLPNQEVDPQQILMEESLAVEGSSGKPSFSSSALPGNHKHEKVESTFFSSSRENAAPFPTALKQGNASMGQNSSSSTDVTPDSRQPIPSVQSRGIAPIQVPPSPTGGFPGFGQPMFPAQSGGIPPVQAPQTPTGGFPGFSSNPFAQAYPPAQQNEASPFPQPTGSFPGYSPPAPFGGPPPSAPFPQPTGSFPGFSQMPTGSASSSQPGHTDHPSMFPQPTGGFPGVPTAPPFSQPTGGFPGIGQTPLSPAKRESEKKK